MPFLPSRPTLSPAKESRSMLGLILVLLLAFGLLSACGDDSPSTPQLPTRTPVPTFTPTPYVIQTGAAAPNSGAVPADPLPANPAQPGEVVPAEPVPDPASAPLAAPLAATATPEAAKAIVTSPTVNVRTGPGTNYDLVGQVERGAELTILARDVAGEWFKVCCVNGQEVWIAGFLVETQGPVESVAVAQNIPAPPVATPAPVQPVNTPAPAQPTNTPVPSFGFVKFGDVLPRSNSNQVVTFWGSLFNSGGNAALGGGFKMVVEGPAGRKEAAFGEVFLNGDPGMESQFTYNAEKVEFTGAVPGVYKVYVADAGGNQVSEAQQFTVEGEIRTFLPRWKQN